MDVSFKIGAYEDTLECDVVPMTVCHLLLGQPWQYDRSVLHNGRNNQYCFKWIGKDLVLRPMTPSQVLDDKVHPPKPHGDKSERGIHHKGSESHKPNMSDHMRSTTNGLVLLATIREIQQVRKN